MTNNSPKHIALNTLFKHKCYSLNNCTDLKRIIESNQFTIIEYKKHANSKPVSELIDKLRIENETQRSDSFLYIKNSLRFLFINANVEGEDKCALLRHELGHISDPNFKNGDANYSKIKKEEFANEFSFYIKNPGIVFKLKLFIIKKWKLIVSMIALLSCVLLLSVMTKSLIIQSTKPVTVKTSSYEISDSKYYVTSAGKKYHRKRCIIVKYKNNLTEMTLNDAINAGYKPCLICCPEE